MQGVTLRVLAVCVCLGTSTPQALVDVGVASDSAVHVGTPDGNELNIDVASGQGLVNLVAGTRPGAGNQYYFGGTNGASRLLLNDGTLELMTSPALGMPAGPVSWRPGLQMDSAGNLLLPYQVLLGANARMVGTLIANGGLTPDYDSGWFAENAQTNHTRVLGHNLGVLPRRTTIWVSDTNDGSFARMAPLETYAHNGSPENTWMTTTQIGLNFDQGDAFLLCEPAATPARVGAPAARTTATCA